MRHHGMISGNEFWHKRTAECTVQEVHERWGIFVHLSSHHIYGKPKMWYGLTKFPYLGKIPYDYFDGGIRNISRYISKVTDSKNTGVLISLLKLFAKV